jgi:hypothetical protein
VKILCPRGHRIADVTRGESGWLIEMPRQPGFMKLGEDGQALTGTRYPPVEGLGARPQRQLACPRECMLERSWYMADSAELQRLADAGMTEHRMPHPAR